MYNNSTSVIDPVVQLNIMTRLSFVVVQYTIHTILSSSYWSSSQLSELATTATCTS